MTKKQRKVKRMKVHKAWADVGSHGGIFEFFSGFGIGGRYPHLLHVYSKKVTKDLVRVEIREIRRGK